MNINLGAKIHNRFDIEIFDTRIGKITETAVAENIILDQMYDLLCSNDGTEINKNIAYGSGSGTLSKSRTALFQKVGSKAATIVETVLNPKGTPSYCKKKITILPEENIGKIITEVGLEGGNPLKLRTHAKIKDAEGNDIFLGPKTDTQQITIYSTVYAEVILPDNVDIIVYDGKNELLKRLLGSGYPSYLHLSSGNDFIMMCCSTNKQVTDQNNNYVSTENDFFQYYSEYCGFSVHDVTNKKSSTNRIRFASNKVNVVHGIRSMCFKLKSVTSSKENVFLRLLFPNNFWLGQQIEGKTIDIGDGATKKFVLYTCDINTSKEYIFYLDGAPLIKDVDYILSNTANETSITFTNAPNEGEVVSGDWWIDYIKKTNEYILDLTFAITYGEGV